MKKNNPLRLLYKSWMGLAAILAWVNTRLILLVIFYLVFTPLGLGLKLFGFDLLDRKIEKQKKSYWKKKSFTDFNPSDYERQF